MLEAPAKARPAGLRLDRTYDVDRLNAELKRLQGVSWKLQQRYTSSRCGSEYHNGRWRGVSLWGPGGRWDSASAGPALEPYRRTPLLDEAPYLDSVVEGFGCPKRSIRLLCLEPGGEVREHRDSQVGLPWGMVRLHVPIVTSPDVELVIGGEPQRWEPGSLWYGDWDQPHALRNRGSVARVHLVMDLAVNDSLLALFPSAFVRRMEEEEGICRAVEPVELSADELALYRCSFQAPAGFLTPEPARATVEPGEGRLLLRFESGSQFALEPWGAGLFGLTGGPPSIRFELDLEEGAVREVRLRTFRGRESQSLRAQVEGRSQDMKGETS